MTLERLDGLHGPARNVVLPAFFQYPRAAAYRRPASRRS